MSRHSIEISLSSQAQTEAFAAKVATVLTVGDVVLLSGPIGAGKTFFCRALIRSRTDTTEDIPSPTFTLVQTYPHDEGDIWHCDLYRLTDPDEAIELGLEDAFEDAICLIEWPDRLGSLTPKDALKIAFEARENGHHATIYAPTSWIDRLDDLDA